MRFTTLAGATALACLAGWTGAANATDIDLTGYTKTFDQEFNTSTICVSAISPKPTTCTWYYQPPYGASAEFSDSIWDAAGDTSPGDGYLHMRAWLVLTDSTAGHHSYGPVNIVLSDTRHLVTGVTTQGTSRTDTPAWYVGEMGIRFTVGGSDVTATQVGRWIVSGNSQSHRIRIVDAATGADVPNGAAVLNTSGKPAGQFAYVSLPASVTLAAGHDYLVLSSEGGGDAYLNDDTVVTQNTFATIDTSAYGTWHSGALSSVDQTGAGAKQKYGYFEVRAQMPQSGTGAFAAWWMLSPNNLTNPGPIGEEADIYEWYGNNYDANNSCGVSEASHNWNNGVDTTPPAKLTDVCTAIPDGTKPWNTFHIYGVKIDTTNMTWYIDGVQVNQIATPSSYIASGTNGAFYWMLDYALGGGWPLTGMVNPSEMLVDWVRVWKLPGAPASFSANPSTVSPGQPSVLSWDFPSAASCRPASGNFDAGTGPTGSATVTPTESTIYKLLCLDSGENKIQVVTVTVR